MTHQQRGFTLIEVMIVIVIIVILTVLGVVSMSGYQTEARDTERKEDIEAIARGFEERYTNGNTKAQLPPYNGSYWPDQERRGKGNYPGVNEVIHILGIARTDFVPDQITGGYAADVLIGTTEASLETPSGNTLYLVCVFACAAPGDTTQLNNAFGDQDKYLYEPIDSAGNICANGDCVRFNLYWKSEVDGTLKTYRSKHQS